jgi:hypothetical protein
LLAIIMATIDLKKLTSSQVKYEGIETFVIDIEPGEMTTLQIICYVISVNDWLSRDGTLHCDLNSNLAVVGTEYQNSVSNNLSKRPANFLIGVIPM